jgi:hypothetical protein
LRFRRIHTLIFRRTTSSAARSTWAWSESGDLTHGNRPMHPIALASVPCRAGHTIDVDVTAGAACQIQSTVNKWHWNFHSKISTNFLSALHLKFALRDKYVEGCSTAICILCLLFDIYLAVVQYALAMPAEQRQLTFELRSGGDYAIFVASRNYADTYKRPHLNVARTPYAHLCVDIFISNPQRFSCSTCSFVLVCHLFLPLHCLCVRRSDLSALAILFCNS